MINTSHNTIFIVTKIPGICALPLYFWEYYKNFRLLYACNFFRLIEGLLEVDMDAKNKYDYNFIGDEVISCCMFPMTRRIDPTNTNCSRKSS